ncbi:MAG: response regulator transcription factor [Taibaiella sp.]|jgi:DNA-binding NarL/FixJ family response regulator
MIRRLLVPADSIDTMITIIIVDGCPFSRLGLKTYLNQFSDFRVIGEATSHDQAIELTKVLRPRILIIDMDAIGLNGLNEMNVIVKDYSDCKLIVLSRFENEKNIIEILQSEVKGLLLKSGEMNELAEAVEKVCNNSEYYSRKIIEVVVHHFVRGNREIKPPLVSYNFTQREIEIIKLVCSQKTAKQIGQQLYISEKTVDFHRQKIIEKMDVRNIIGLVVYAIRKGIVDIKELHQ